MTGTHASGCELQHAGAPFLLKQIQESLS